MALEHAEVVCRPCVFADCALHWMMRRFKIRMSIDIFCSDWPIIRMRACPRWHGGEKMVQKEKEDGWSECQANRTGPSPSHLHLQKGQSRNSTQGTALYDSFSQSCFDSVFEKRKVTNGYRARCFALDHSKAIRNFEFLERLSLAVPLQCSPALGALVLNNPRFRTSSRSETATSFPAAPNTGSLLRP